MSNTFLHLRKKFFCGAPPARRAKSGLTKKQESSSHVIYFTIGKIKIQDFGYGIDKKDLKHIFERFYKAKNSSEDSIGIGLSLSKAIIEKNNGYIKVDSELKKGSTFEIKYMK